MPDQDAMVPGIGDRQYAVAGRNSGRHIERGSANLALGVASLAREIRLADHKVGASLIAGWRLRQIISR